MTYEVGALLLNALVWEDALGKQCVPPQRRPYLLKLSRWLVRGMISDPALRELEQARGPRRNAMSLSAFDLRGSGGC